MKKHATLLYVSLILNYFFDEIGGQITPTVHDVQCFNFDTACSLCIQEPLCQWCSQSKRNQSEHHCFSAFTDLSSICNEIENPQNSPLDIIEDKPLTDPRKENLDYKDIVQMRPQRVGIKLRKGVPENITVSYRQVKDYPLDLYYLMDLSRSMYEDKITLANLGKKLARTMRTLTGQFKIGFGSFVDKVMLPYVNNHPNSLRNPCNDIDCVTPFSFKNNLPLNEEDSEFVKQVGAAKISSNLDSPEGGFDALMQAMVCEKIGWRENVRKIIIFSTDALPHSAGDGKLAGVVKPNDGKCHLDKNGYYTKYDEYDYPSIGQLDQTAQEKGINIIFAVKGHQEFYKKLSERIKDSSFGELDEKSGNVIDLVTNVYNSITGKVEIGVKSRDRNSPATVRFFTDCGNGGPLQETKVCNNVKEGTSFDFTVEIMVTDCPKSKERKTQIEIGTLQESILVDLELLCDCGCESEGHMGYEKQSASCSESGTKQCEVCLCNEGFYGQRCQCSKSRVSFEIDNDQNKCRPGGNNSSESVCSGKGRCECETCICWKERHYGRFCECDKGRCRQNLNENSECSGNGRCSCNQCLCNPGFEGQYCECRSKRACYQKADEEICSGNGECYCGKCECDSTYTGKYCEECPVCEASKCTEFAPCVQCDVWRSGKLKGEPCKNCTFRNIPRVEDLEPHRRQKEKLCQHEDEETGCHFFFTYKYSYEEDKYDIYAESEQKCPEQINTLAVTLGVIAGIVLIGVLTLIIWKISTTIHDRREFNSFVNESRNAAWNTQNNPIYKSATTTVANPGFSAM